MPQPNVNQASSTAGKRRSRRFPFISPVEATWQEPNGKILREAGQAMEVNAQGGLLEMKTYPAVGTQIEITNLLSHESSHARVVGLRRNAEGRLLGVAVELLVPSDTFWGVNFQLKKACADLVKLEYDMRSGTRPPGRFKSGKSANRGTRTRNRCFPCSRRNAFAGLRNSVRPSPPPHSHWR
jgi:hypothetical protein